MSIFKSIVEKIFGSRSAQADVGQNATIPGGSPSSQQQGSSMQGGQQQSAQSSMGVQQGSSASPVAISPAQVETIIQGIATRKGAPSNWKESIVDLMKLLDLDSSLNSRKELAQELGYKGALDGSAA